MVDSTAPLGPGSSLSSEDNQESIPERTVEQRLIRILSFLQANRPSEVQRQHLRDADRILEGIEMNLMGPILTQTYAEHETTNSRFPAESNDGTSSPLGQELDYDHSTPLDSGPTPPAQYFEEQFSSMGYIDPITASAGLRRT
jgi:hypothetical protein